ncbi:response regulator transcription factor [Bacillus sp. 2205SS5-2]|uniref:response regulator transcription factor n=1 Tax=Bacillus sp. 2205SS5-2 TaxID=3109031 RepID=UPI003006CCC6
MVKLLIVDDEQIEREGMQAILQMGFPEMIIKQAKNGHLAVDMALTYHPDLILMDIKMPGMNGLEAIEVISARDSTIQFIMVTAYDSFDYLRLAMNFGVKDYVLKPSRPSEIVEIVGKVVEKIKEEKQRQEKMKLQQEKTLALVETDVVTQLLFDHVHEVHVDMLMEMLDLPVKSEMFVLLVVIPVGSENIYSAVKEKVSQTKSGWVGAVYGSQLPIILFRNQSESFRSQATRLAREILSLTKSKPEAGWFVGIGSECRSFEHIRQSYQDSLMAAMDTSLPVKYHFYSDLTITGDVCGGQPIKQELKEFSEHIRLGQWDQVRFNLMNVIQCYEKEGANLLKTQQRVQEALWMVSQVMNEMGVEIATPLYSSQLKDYLQLISVTDRLLKGMKQSFNEHYHRVEDDTMHRLKQYIIKHSQDDISLEALGNQVGLSPIYISKMFKEKLGVNYIDFLTECRLEKAKKLLTDSEKSIKEITYEVGYHDPNYFSKVFKKMVTVTPKEYRKSLLVKMEG